MSEKSFPPGTTPDDLCADAGPNSPRSQKTVALCLSDNCFQAYERVPENVTCRRCGASYGRWASRHIWAARAGTRVAAQVEREGSREANNPPPTPNQPTR